MRVFVTGASGHIGSAVTAELLGAGHEVLGLARSESAAAAVRSLGARVHRGDLADLDSLHEAAASSDGVIHLAFPTLGSDMAESLETDRRAIEAIGAALEDSGKALVGTTPTLTLSFVGGITDRPATEDDVMRGGPRVDAENAVLALAERGVRASVVRLPPLVHSSLDRHGLFPALIGIARAQGVSGYVADGSNRWPAVHTLDAARLYRLALESAPAGSRLHAVAEEGVTFRAIAEVIARRLNMATKAIAPEDVLEHFSHLAPFVALDNPVHSERTRQQLDWKPTHPALIEDLDQDHYFQQ